MNCEHLRERLPLLIYGDLGSEEEQAANAHLAGCPDCCQARDALVATRHALDSAAVPEATVDLRAIHAETLAMQARTMRRWKRFAIAASTLAAGLLAFLLIRPDIRVGDGQLVIRWAPSTEQMHATAPAPQSVRDADLEERIRLLNSLVHSLQKQVDGNEQQVRKEVEYALVCLELLRIQSQQQWEEIRRDMGVLHTAQIGKRD